MQETMAVRQCLNRLLNEYDTVFIVPHDRPDIDALASALGMALICEKYKKKYYIIINDKINEIESVTKKILEKVKDKFEIVSLSEVENLIDKNSLMIAVDVNKKYRVSTEKYLEKFGSILIIDHHDIDENTINTKYAFIDDELSSASEEICRLMILNQVEIKPEIANYLLAGINLDTNRYTINAEDRTHLVIALLYMYGANSETVNNYFLKDFEQDRMVQKLVSNSIKIDNVRIACQDEEDNNSYLVEDIAKAADYLLDFPEDLTFAIAHINEDTIFISARSKKKIDLASIVKQCGDKGGGSKTKAAVTIKGMKIEEVKNKLINVLKSQNIISQDDQMILKLKNN